VRAKTLQYFLLLLLGPLPGILIVRWLELHGATRYLVGSALIVGVMVPGYLLLTRREKARPEPNGNARA
jgi:hypothetical protein